MPNLTNKEYENIQNQIKQLELDRKNDNELYEKRIIEQESNFKLIIDDLKNKLQISLNNEQLLIKKMMEMEYHPDVLEHKRINKIKEIEFYKEKIEKLQSEISNVNV